MTTLSVSHLFVVFLRSGLSPCPTLIAANPIATVRYCSSVVGFPSPVCGSAQRRKHTFNTHVTFVNDNTFSSCL